LIIILIEGDKRDPHIRENVRIENYPPGDGTSYIINGITDIQKGNK
jgi:hypothetical protein